MTTCAPKPLLPEAARATTELTDRKGKVIKKDRRVSCQPRDTRSARIGGLVLDTYLDHRGRPVVDVREFATHATRSFHPDQVTVQDGKSVAQRQFEEGVR